MKNTVIKKSLLKVCTLSLPWLPDGVSFMHNLPKRGDVVWIVVYFPVLLIRIVANFGQIQMQGSVFRTRDDI